MNTFLEMRSAPAFAPVESGSTRFAALFVALATVILLPLAVIDLPLLADYPNHVARMHVLSNLHDNLVLADRYVANVDLIPNIAMDLVVPRLAEVMPLDVAARIFLGFCLVTTLAGTAFLHRTLFGHWSPHSLLAAFFAYHGSMMVGMVNFSLGAALVPLAFAIWIRMLDAEARWRLLIGGVMTLVLFFCHLVAFGVFGILVIGCTLTRIRERWDRPAGGLRPAAAEVGIAGAIGLVPIFLFLRLLLSVEDGSAATGIVEGGAIWGHASWKLKALLSPLANYHLPLDAATFALLTGLALIAWRTGWLTVNRRIAPGLCLLALAFVLAPKALWSGGVFDQRLAVALALLLVGGTRVSLPPVPLFRLLPALLTLLLLVRIGVLTSAWIDHRSDLAEMRLAIDRMAPGARVLVALPDDHAGQRLAPARHRVLHHAVQLQSLPTLAVIEKSAFVSTLYALPGQQPLALKPPFDRLGGRGPVGLPTLDDLQIAHHSDAADPKAKPQIRAWVQDFDYVVMIYGYGEGIDPAIQSLPLEPLMDGDILDLFRIIKDGAPGLTGGAPALPWPRSSLAGFVPYPSPHHP